MKNTTRELFNDYLGTIAELNGIDAGVVIGGAKFAAEPSVQQTLETKIQESSDFLTRINMPLVDEMKGEKLGLGISGLIASRTDTSAADRQTKDPTTLDTHSYECKQTNFDTHLTYGKLDMWAKFPDFQTKIRDAIVKAQALDKIRVGFNGTSAAADTDAVANPLGQDVNVGWLEHIRNDAPAHVFDEGTAVVGQVTYGAAGDYANLDALVYDAVNNFLPSWAAGDTELVAILGRDLLHDKYFPVIAAAGDQATEQVARDVIMASKRVGGLMAASLPFFPAGSILVTRFDNLSIYAQDGKRRRAVIDNPKRDRIENYESSNDAYVVEDYDFALLVENITRKDA
jgi:P2 family phage major capsid protein